MSWQAIGLYPALPEPGEERCGHRHRTKEAALKCGLKSDTWDCGTAGTPASFHCVRSNKGEEWFLSEDGHDPTLRLISAAESEEWLRQMYGH